MECTLQTGAALAMMGVAAPAVGLAGLLRFARNDGEGGHREAAGRGDPDGFEMHLAKGIVG